MEVGDSVLHPLREVKMESRIPIMGTRAVHRGPTSSRVAENVSAIRATRQLSLRGLSERMRELGGRPTQASGLSKIEQGDRRVDVDDLVALAIALDVSPNRLLLTADASDGRVELIPGGFATTRTAWRWGTGEKALPLDLWGKPGIMDFDRLFRFKQENRPHDPPDSMPVSEISEHEGVLRPVVEAIAKARRRGLSMKTILGYVEMADTMMANLSRFRHEGS